MVRSVRSFVAWRLLFGLALFLVAALARGQGIQPPSIQQPPQVLPIEAGPSAILRGRVYAADSGQPLRKAQVRLTSASGGANATRENRVTDTDANGAYEFKELPAGRYDLTASKGGYVSLSYGQMRPFEPGRPIELLDAQVLERVDFSLPRGGVITGRIVDAYGEPLSEVVVAAIHAARGNPTTRTTTTDDLGEFRLHSLAPGEYYVQATSRLVGPFAPPNTPAGDRTGHATTFFPGVVDQGQAKKVAVGMAQVVADVSFAMQTTRTARVSGTALDSRGQPVAGILTVIRRTGNTMSGSGSPIQPDGSFVLTSVAPGEYTLVARTMGDDPEVGTATINVGSDDITGIQLVAGPYISATGRIVIDPAALQRMPNASMSVTTFPASPADMLPVPMKPARVAEDLTFSLQSPPGRRQLQVVGQPTGFAVRAVRVGGVDVTDDGIEFKRGAVMRDIEVELTNRLSSISGLVTNERGAPARDYTAVLFTQDSNRWKASSRYIRVARPDQDGRFTVTALPPGDYYASAIEAIEPGAWTDPEFLQRVRTQATMFSLMEGETKTLDLRLQTVR